VGATLYYCNSFCQRQHWHQHRETCLSHAASLRTALTAPVTQSRSPEVQYLTHLAQGHATHPPDRVSQYLNLAPPPQSVELSMAPISVAHVLLRLGQTVQKCLIDTRASWSAVSSDVASYLLRAGRDQRAQAIELAPERLSMDTAGGVPGHQAFKVSFQSTTSTFLGFFITTTGLSTDPACIRAVTDFPSPNDQSTLSKKVDAVARSCGMAGFYRRFARNLAVHERALRELTMAKTPWIWGETQQAALDAKMLSNVS
jgi:hypothetical protein